MKKYLLLLIIIISSTLDLLSQFDARQLPEYLDIKWVNKERADSKKRKVYYKNFPPEAYQKYKGPDRILADGIEIVNLSGGNNNQSETWITYNPQNPDNIVAGANDYWYLNTQTGYKMSSYATFDGFKNWVHSTTPDNNGAPIEIPSGFDILVFDPGLTFDSRGWCYYSYGVAQIDAQERDYDNGLFVCRSKDGGKTWGEQVAVALSMSGTLYQAFNDRYSIAADAITGSPYKDNIYLTWKRFVQNTGICFSKSTDAGESWSQPTLVPGGKTDQSQSPIPVVGPNGEVYIIWRNPNNGQEEALFQKSTNGGSFWLLSPKKVQSLISIGTLNSVSRRYVLEKKGNMRVSALPYMAVDNSNGPRRGYIYVVQAGKDDNGLTRLYMAKSTNGGDDWTNKIRIDDNQYGNDIWFPNVSVDPVTGMVSVVYYSSQNDPNNVGFDVYLAVSSDGINFRNIRITPQMIYIDSPDDIIGNNGNYYWGDYTSITSYNGKIYPCWWMPSGYNTSFWTNDVYVALLSSNPKPPTNFDALSSYQTPTNVTLNWTDPLINQLSESLGNFVIVIYRDGVEIARVNKGTQTYTDQTAVDGRQYLYSVKTLTPEGLESNLVYYNIVAGGALKPYPPIKIKPIPTANGVLLSWENPLYHVDSSYCHDVIKIDIYVNDVKSQTYSGSIQAGQISSIDLNLQPNQFHLIKLKAVAKRGQTETESDFSDVSVAYAGLPLTELNDNFDTSPDPTAKYTNQGWGVTNIKSVSPPNSITDSPQGKYENSAKNYLYFPPVIITPAKTTLSFEHIAIIHNKGDFGIVWISKDFGVTWKTILSVNQDRSPGFTDDITTSSWYSERVGLSEYVGDTVMVAFELYSNSFNNRDGWYIDNLIIDDSPALVDELDYKNSGLTMEVSPNPLTNYINIDLFLPFGNEVTLSIFDILGNEIKQVYRGYINPGVFDLKADLSDLYNGIYYCRAKVGNFGKTVPIVVNK